VRIGIIGAGGMGREHAANLAALPGVEIGVVADAVGDAAASLADAYGAVATTDGMGVIAAGEVDALVIASPDDTHAVYTLAAIETGTPVLCEKPLAVTMADAAEVAEREAALSQPLVQVGLMRVFDPAHLQVRAALADLGRVRHIRAVHRNNHERSRPIEEIITQSLIHDFHSVRWLAGADLAEISVRWMPRPGGAQFVHAVAGLANGGLATVEFDDLAFGYEVALAISAEHGMVHTPPEPLPLVRRDGRAVTEIGNDWFGRFTVAYRREVRSWMDAIRSGRMVGGPGVADALAAQAVAEAAMASAAGGGAAVPVPAIG
jgi:myo-inositol 2-dehydrogenase/D-chiro-inositol 1-dehydrogenase